MALKKKLSFAGCWENQYPLILAGMLTTAAWVFHFNEWIDFKSLLSNLLVISAIFVGFLGTSIGIIFTSSSKRIEWLKVRGGLWNKAINFFREAFSLNLLLCIASLIFISISFPDENQIKQLAFLTITFSSTSALLAFHRAIRLFFIVLLDR
ncbi:MAG: hypothetical protein Q8J59_05125 [Methylotenera sp.]|uniref:hypothetical protein n=1 Tax=Methylotenera sp. TaxID=2051956 RepID=UPI0027331D82|nr:hypothetical protein [Methylotenera sp.]MDP2102092.1 hypothetical protein [Methylotenera sp.]MDP2281052.1 hypothetical protein [Methylotenera sp.]MDP3061147.1 hypothetical protein [Methylotenera sp.]MDP3210916.1 hypothetical protein [Methylotenera sp.]